MAQNALILPAGVVPPPATLPPSPAGPPFDRAFFESILPEVAVAFCERAQCDSVIVELLTADGTTHLVRGISALHDQWVALQVASTKHQHEVDVFIPYQTIYRIEIHPRLARQPRRLGFRVHSPEQSAAPLLLEQGPAVPAEPS